MYTHSPYVCSILLLSYLLPYIHWSNIDCFLKSLLPMFISFTVSWALLKCSRTPLSLDFLCVWMTVWCWRTAGTKLYWLEINIFFWICTSMVISLEMAKPYLVTRPRCNPTFISGQLGSATVLDNTRQEWKAFVVKNGWMLVILCHNHTEVGMAHCRLLGGPVPPTVLKFSECFLCTADQAD